MPDLPGYLRRPVVTDDGEGPPRLLDVVVELLMNLTARTADDPGAFLDGDHTWQGQRSIDSRLTTVFGLQEGRVVAVGASDDLLTQFVTPLPDADFDVTVTLAGHGRRQVDLPPEEETTDAVDDPELAAALGTVAQAGEHRRKTAGEGGLFPRPPSPGVLPTRSKPIRAPSVRRRIRGRGGEHRQPARSGGP